MRMDVIIMGRAQSLALATFAGAFGKIVRYRSVEFTLGSIEWEDRCRRRFTTKRAPPVWACASPAVLIPGRSILV